ncbi:MAG: DUF669 domain-containing protein [Synergistaceae bacterium]|nr:DUF669 domain-containing protein [Synergistaceae bacterium]
MAVLSQDFLNSFRSVEASNFDPLPEGEYIVKVDSADIRQAKTGRGQYINVQFDVIGPKFQGRKLFTRLNIVHDNPEVARIGQQQLKSLLLSGGMTADQVNQFNDTDQLIGLTCSVRVDVEDAKGQYGPQNRVRSFRKAESAAPSIPAGNNFSDAFASPGDKPWFA